MPEYRGQSGVKARLCALLHAWGDDFHEKTKIQDIARSSILETAIPWVSFALRASTDSKAVNRVSEARSTFTRVADLWKGPGVDGYLVKSVQAG